MDTIEVNTDTSTICIFDIENIAHRKSDVGDWWSFPKNEIQEANNGNALFLNLGEDGLYLVNISKSDFQSEHEYNISVKSGRLFIGPGEETSGGGFEPDGSWGGRVIYLYPGNYKCKIRKENYNIYMFFCEGGSGTNKLTDQIRI